MHLIKQPNRYTCMACSLAMVIDESLKDVLEIIGHDGSEVWFPELKFPLDRRGFNAQEIIDAGIAFNKPLVEILLFPTAYNAGSPEDQKPVYSSIECKFRANYYLERYNGIISGKTRSGGWHSVAWCKETQKCFDPGADSPMDLDLVFDVLHSILIAWEDAECTSEGGKSRM